MGSASRGGGTGRGGSAGSRQLRNLDGDGVVSNWHDAQQGVRICLLTVEIGSDSRWGRVMLLRLQFGNNTRDHVVRNGHGSRERPEGSARVHFAAGGGYPTDSQRVFRCHQALEECHAEIKVTAGIFLLRQVDFLGQVVELHGQSNGFERWIAGVWKNFQLNSAEFGILKW